MPMRSVGGGDWFYNPLNGAGQRGVANAAGLNNIGLLVTTWGWVMVSSTGFFVIGEAPGSDPGSPQLKVLCPAGGLPPPAGAFVRVTGAVSCENAAGIILPVIQARSQADVTVLVFTGR